MKKIINMATWLAIGIEAMVICRASGIAAYSPNPARIQACLIQIAIVTAVWYVLMWWGVKYEN